jgi:hypothetical protein
MAVTQYDEALRQVRSLNPSDQKRLLIELTEQLEASPKETLSILSLQGLGKDLWLGVDTQEYVNHERDSWEKAP